MSNVWFTSDTHFGHERVAQIRGFSCVTEHDEFVIKRWNEVVSSRDEVWHLGDVGLRGDFLSRCVTQLRGRIHLITGNHDAPWPGNRRSHVHQPKWLHYFDSVQAFTRRRIAGRDVMLSHFPYKGDHTVEDRYSEFRLRTQHAPLLCGHVHSAWKTSTVNGCTALQINVGVDVNDFRPVEISEIRKLLE